MTIETTVFTFKLSNTFEEWLKMFDSPEIDAFHKKVGLTPLYRGKSIINPKNMEITLKKETSLGLETYDVLGFNSEEELELEISKLTKFRPEFDTNL